MTINMENMRKKSTTALKGSVINVQKLEKFVLDKVPKEFIFLFY